MTAILVPVPWSDFLPPYGPRDNQIQQIWRSCTLPDTSRVHPSILRRMRLVPVRLFWSVKRDSPPPPCVATAAYGPIRCLPSLESL
jgi:transposase